MWWNALCTHFGSFSILNISSPQRTYSDWVVHMVFDHLGTELAGSTEKIEVRTQYGPVRGRRLNNGTAGFLEIPFALPARRWEDPSPLPEDYQYESKEYINESKYAVQPTDNGQAAGKSDEEMVGLGEPSEDPLFVNIIIPPACADMLSSLTAASLPASEARFPVKIYIHGGFLQFGSPHGLSGQAKYVSAERQEIWVNVGYRLSAFGFLASDIPRVDGNFGFKDQWLALKWIKANIASFGGDTDNIVLTGLSAGAHAVHQILHHVSLLPENEQAPFKSAILQSNAIINDPKSPEQLRPQFQALCQALGIDPEVPDVLTTLRNSEKVPWSKITSLISSQKLGMHGTFRGNSDGDWMSTAPGAMEWQRSGGLARGLKAHGVQSVVIGDLKEEWYLYAIAHEVTTMDDIRRHLSRYYPESMAVDMLNVYKDRIKDQMTHNDVFRLFGDVLSAGQVHLPVRLLHRDLLKAGFPAVRYEIRWTPEQFRPPGNYVTHGTDRPIWAFFKPILQQEQVEVARAWLDAVDRETKRLEAGGKPHDLKEILVLNEDRTITWSQDEKWESYTRLLCTLPGETC